jgi:hypothetical protein
LELDGYRPAAVKITTESGKELPLKLQLEPRTGTLEVRSHLSEGEVQIERNGKVIKTMRLGQSAVIPTGSYLIRLQAADHQTVESRVFVRENTTEQVVLESPRLPPKRGRLLVNAEGREAYVDVDGKAVGVTPLSLEVPVGTRKVEIRTSGCGTWTGTLSVQENQAAYVNAHLDCGRKP